ncbi:VCBS repeat-containing protein [Desulfosediminicola flagellatus]|uniref:VCBS repeat-containing protein n=1 Tax=Desulfosediminicola flagellatus TaxID=2569541 RepID=UPI0010AC22B7|nr:VCBS repeat-containing protein [Desulfosediminicola flagellatus]
MIISDSSIQLSSERKSIEKHTIHESLNVWGGNAKAFERDEDDVSQTKIENTIIQQADMVRLSANSNKGRPQRALVTPVEHDQIKSADLNIMILRSMIERITGKVIDVHIPQDGVSPQEVGQDIASKNAGSVEPAILGNGFGLEYDYYESHYEYESTSFTAEGIIATADGHEIDFNVQLNMTREFMTEQSISIRAGEALKDPLTINFSGNAAELTQTMFEFDIDMDGRDDQIAFVNPGSGFLALDMNMDGQVNDGSELFGPNTGDGFAELAEYDSDGNRWIDENDSIFEHLRIWTKNSEGANQLFSLGEKGIGAIYLNHIDSPFALKDKNNELLGQVQNTGVFVKDDGTVGTIQQIDLAV